MGRKIDLTGSSFGQLVVIEQAERAVDGGIAWKCKCVCGKEAIVRSGNLLNGGTKSCGCYREGLRQYKLRHRYIYLVWVAMRQRCFNPQNKDYKYYGGRGIAVCDKWNNPKPFIKWAVEHGWKRGLEIDRINNNKDYTPDNCRFATRSGNTLNSRLIRSDNSSGFRGVHWDKTKKKYFARLQLNGKRHYLGSFPTAIEAAKARDVFVIKKGLHTPLNFPQDKTGVTI